MQTEALIPILFKVLFALIAINAIVNFILFLAHPRKMYKLLFGYWLSLLGVFIVQSFFQEGNLPVALAFSFTFLPVTILGFVAFRSLGMKFPLKYYIVGYTLSVPCTLIIHAMGGNFTQIAMPLSIASAAPIFHSAYLFLISRRDVSTRLQKFLGVLYCAIGAHAINFALFRMEPGSQLWGWLVAYACYDILGILMPSIALEKSSIEEKARLEGLVKERTQELLSLNKELKATTRINETLLKVLLHDISNPLQTILFVVSFIKEKPEVEKLSEKLSHAAEGINSVLHNVRTMYGGQNAKRSVLKRDDIIKCVEDVHFSCKERLAGKNIRLTINENLSSDTAIYAEQTALTHSVLGNLVTNSIKFSSSGSELVINISDYRGGLEIEVKDSGDGMSDEQVKALISDGRQSFSREGTSGERGYGMGISIVKSFMDFFDGQLHIVSRPRNTYPTDHGTVVRLRFHCAATRRLR